MVHVSLSRKLQREASMEPAGPSASARKFRNMKSSMSSPGAKRRQASFVRQLHSSPGLSNSIPVRTANIKRWDGHQRTTTVWDSLRRDPELWFPTGDCLIHFYESGQSKRGASLQISLADIRDSGCKSFLELYEPLPLREPSSAASSPLSDDGNYDVPSPTAKYEIYVPAPMHLGREDAFRYHLTTRNIFAWMFDLPIVGGQLGEALIALLERMKAYRRDETRNQQEMLAYLDSQQYTDFRQCPDHSLAILQFAERYELHDLWTDAFVHCAGMNDELILSGEFESTSRISKALIMRAYLEMNVRLERAGKSLGNFLEEDLSGAYLGLGNEAQAHLERFRSFLHSFYVGKFGYWPPAPIRSNSTAVPKSTCRSMYFEFRNLYEYLVDPLSSSSFQDNRPADGGLCVLQNVQAFDKRRKYASLPHPLSLVPEIPESLHKQTPRLLRIFGSSQAKFERRLVAYTTLAAATNSCSPQVMECPLVREYMYFEKTWTMRESGTLPCAEARKVRWILIYAILQTLISVTCAPKEVRDPEGVSYPLCCQVGGTPPWAMTATPKKYEEKLESFEADEVKKAEEIKPDVDNSLLRSSQLIPEASAPSPSSFSPKASLGQDVVLDSPERPRTSICDILCNGFGEHICENDAASVISTSSSPVDGAASGGWSSSSSDDGMEHGSVSESISLYGENEGEKVGVGKAKLMDVSRRTSFSSFQPNRCNPEVERYILS